MNYKNYLILAVAVLFLGICLGCGSSGNGDDWGDNPGVVRVSNLKGRVIAPLLDANSSRAQSTIPRFSLVSTQGTRVFIEDNSNLFAYADMDGYFVIPNVPEGMHRIVANIVSGTTSYRQRSDVITVTGQYETQEMPYAMPLEPALYNVRIHVSDLMTSASVNAKVNIWGFTFNAVNGIVDLGPFPAGTMSKEATISAIGYRDLKTLITFGETCKSELYIKMTPNSSTDSNQAPVVEIKLGDAYSSDVVVRTNEQITLSGVGVDPEGDALKWKWTATAGSFANENFQITNYVAPASSGTVSISLTGYDSKNAAGIAKLNLNIIQGGSPGPNYHNHPPIAPNTPFPENQSTGMNGELYLAWDCYDQDNDRLTYTVNFGKQGSDLKIIASNLEQKELKIKDLEANTRYYWQVTAYDENYASANSEVWSFTTGDLNNIAPNIPTFPSPAHLTTDIEDYVAFSWSGGDLDGDPVTYGIYIATISTWIPSEPTPLTLVQTTNLLKFDYYGLAKGATYQWQIIATDKPGAKTEGPIWQFSTKEPENNMPSFASITEPADKSIDMPVNQKLRWSAEDLDNDTLYYDVYFGTTSEPELVSASQTEQIYDPGKLENNVTYYWKVVVSDGRIANPRSDLWSFKTVEVVDEKPTVVNITTPADSESPLIVEFSEYIDKSKSASAFSFNPAVSGNWVWKNDNTIAEFLPDGGMWYPGSYNKFTLAANVLEDATGNKIESLLTKAFTVPSNIPVPTGYRSYAFPVKVPANRSLTISVPELEYGRNSYILAVADADNTSGTVSSMRASIQNDLTDEIIKKDPTYLLRLEEANMITKPIVINNTSRRASMRASMVGDVREFYINSIATSTAYPRNIVNATLTKASGNTLVYVDNAITDPNKDNEAQKVLNTFDSKILQQVRNNFGNEPEIGVDGESRISIVLINLPDENSTAGYFTSADLYKRDEGNVSFRISNEGKLFYIHYGMADSTTFGTLAHEFQHMINYYQKNKSLKYTATKIFEETWLNESLSKYSEEICGYSLLDGDVSTTLLVKNSMENNRKLSLTYWGDDTINCYGQVYLFMHFLAQQGRYSSNSDYITRSLVTGAGEGKIGEENIEAVTNEPFKETMAKWALSLFLNNYSSSSSNAYGIHGINLMGKYNGVTLPGYTIENISSTIALNDMKHKNSVRCFRKASTGSGNTNITVTTGSQPITLWCFDERD